MLINNVKNYSVVIGMEWKIRKLTLLVMLMETAFKNRWNQHSDIRIGFNKGGGNERQNKKKEYIMGIRKILKLR